MSVLRKLYEPKQKRITGWYDIVVPHDYLILEDGSLPEATIRCLDEAMRRVANGDALHIAWGNTATSGADPDDMNQRKLAYLRSKGFRDTPTAMVTCTNTITEVNRILEATSRPRSVISVCEWRHSRRTQNIWRYFLRGELAVVTVDSDWKENHVSKWCRPRCFIPARYIFLAATMAHHALLKVRGVDAMRNVVHSR